MQYFGVHAPKCPRCGQPPSGCKRLSSVVLNGGPLDDLDDDVEVLDAAPAVNSYAAPVLTVNCPSDSEGGVTPAFVDYQPARVLADNAENILPDPPTIQEMVANEQRQDRLAALEKARKQAARGDGRAQREYQRLRHEHETEAARLTANAGLPENVLPDPGLLYGPPLW